MGEAKRREQYRKEQKQLCVLCGIRSATTLDHVPPKGIFVRPRPRLITVPACEPCNVGASAAEEGFKLFLSAKNGPPTPAAVAFWQQGGLRTLNNNQRLRREFLSGTPFWIRSPTTGRFEETRTFKWPVESHDPVIEKITRGLYYHHFNGSLSPTTSVSVYYLDRLTDELRDIAMGENVARSNLGGDDRFCYAYGRTAESPESTLWMYQFYMHHWAAAITRPQNEEVNLGAYETASD